MWLGLVAYFALVGLRVLLNYRSLRNYLRLPLIEGPAGPKKARRLATVALPGEIPDTHSQWLLFTSSWVQHEPAAQDRMLRFALQRKAEAVAILLQQRCVSFWERMLLPFVAQQFFIGGPGKAFVVAHDLLIQRSRVDGASPADLKSPAELAAHIQDKGTPLLVARAERLGHARPYNTFGDLQRGAGAQLLAGGPATLFGLAVSILAVPCAIYGLATGSFPFTFAALVTWITSVAEMALWNFVYQVPFGYGVFQPLASLVAWVMVVRTLVSHPKA